MKIITIPVTRFEQNCTVLICEQTNKAAIVDPGGDLPDIRQAIEDAGCDIEKILLTHAHIDHVGGARALATEYGVKIIGPQKEDSFWVDRLRRQAKMFDFKGALLFQPEQWLEDGDEVTVGAQTLKVLHCPGHTPGHIVFYHERDKLAIVGDVIFKGSIGRTDFPKGDFRELKKSITEKLWPLGDDVSFICGHGEGSTFGVEREPNPFVADWAIHVFD